jgi:hypothetical protein
MKPLNQKIQWMFFFMLLCGTVQATLPYTYTTNNGAITITGYTGSGGAVDIPSVIDGLPVTRIERGAFDGNRAGDSLTRITVPDSVISIGTSAFFVCRNLTNAMIGTGVTNIETFAFYFCTSLTEITVADGNSTYSSVDGVLFNKSRTALIQYPGGKAGSYNVSGSVTSIGDYAFSHCLGLTAVAIPDSVTNIGDAAFYICGLTNVVIGSGVANIGDYAFSSCYSLTSITIPNNVTSIGDYAFGPVLTNVMIGTGVTNIGTSAFVDCYNLIEITIAADNLTYSSAGGVLFNKSRTVLIQYPEGKAGNYTVPDSVTSIGDSAFFSCCSLTSVVIPNGVTNIGNSAFTYCINLTSITIPSSVAIIESRAFSDCYSLTNVTIGSGVINIGDFAFYYCYYLTSVTIPNSVTHLGDGAFAWCYSLRGLYFMGNAPSVVTLN